jgi:integrase
LNILDLDEGETAHRLRAGCAVMLALSGSDTVENDLKQHMGWSSDKMADYYGRASRMSDASRVALTLARSVQTNKTKVILNSLGIFLI